MNRLIRAEVYRLLHSRTYLHIFLLSFFAVFFFPLLGDFELYEKTLAEGMESLSVGGILSLMLLPLLIALFVALGYTKKTAYYEVMTGSKISHIIGSRLVTEGLLLGTVCFVAMIGLGGIVAVKNGVGDVTDLWLRAVLLFVVCVHATVVGTLIGLAVKNIAAPLLVYVRCMIADMTLALGVFPLLYTTEVISETVYRRLNRCTIFTQMSEVFGPEISTELAVITVASFLAEAVFWYGIVYLTMKKKWYK